MNRKRTVLVSSTPHPEKSRHLASLFEDMDFSPIAEASQTKVTTDLPLKNGFINPSSSVKTGAVRKRRALSKKEVVLDSDTEENISSTLKPPKKSKQDSKVISSRPVKKEEEKKKPKERAPGSSRITRVTRPAADRKEKKKPCTHSSTVTSTLKEVQTSRTKPRVMSKPPSYHSSPSVVELANNEDDDIFPVYQPGTSIYQSSNTNKIRKNRLSLELDDDFPIQWSGIRKKTDLSEKFEKLTNCGTNENNNRLTNSKNVDKPSIASKVIVLSDEDDLKPISSNDEGFKSGDVYQEKENTGVKTRKQVSKSEIKKEEVKPLKTAQQGKTIKTTVLNELEPKCSSDAKVAGRQAINGNKDSPVMISRFEDVIFKVSNACGGIVAKCLKTDQNDVGYLEVIPDQVFNGQSTDITFVVIEGKAKVLHLGTKQILSPGDMIHIHSDSGYQFESVGKGHVRFLYIKAH